MRSFFYMLDKTILNSQIEHKLDLVNFCYDVKSFVSECTFTKYKKAKTVLDYWGESDSYVSKMTGMTEGAIRQARRMLSNELYELFGYDFFEIIASGSNKSLEEGRYRLHLVSKGYSSDSFLYRELVSKIKKEGNIKDDIDITSCMLEIQFLVRHSKQCMEEEMKFLDKDKLLYLVRMLDNEAGSPVNIRNLIRVFEKEISNE